MFYKKGFLNKKIIDLYENEGSLEFAIAMKENFKNKNKNVEIQAILSKDNNDVIKYIPVFDNKYTITISGYHSTSRFYLNNLERKNKDYSNLYIEPINIDLKIKNKKFYNNAKELIKDFYKLENSVIVNDKEGKQYRIDVYSDTDPILNEFLTQDSLFIYDLETNKKIGHIKAKYSTTEMNSFYHPTLIHEFLSEYNLTYLIKNCKSKEDILKVLEDKKYLKDIDYTNIEQSFKKAEKKLYKKQKEQIEDSRARWINIATTEYSSLETKNLSFDTEDKIDYRNKGLAQLMYFYMAKHFTSKGLTFRSSTMLNENSQKVWNNLIKNFPNNIKNVYQLKL